MMSLSLAITEATARSIGVIGCTVMAGQGPPYMTLTAKLRSQIDPNARPLPIPVAASTSLG
jgi:hypothetical protein